ncbi:MAG: CerR family C-terminal domain-containing protein [Deltaproteobacteria bacterium]|nr:CerR family C-terminal domain-containing protein [Deltaproteobacteria bacterium]
MRKQRSDAVNTRQNLLDAAGAVFAKKGFWSATHEEICSRANANLAAINYHFGSKENLYIEAWKYSFEKSLKKYPTDGGALPKDPVEKRMRGRVLSILRRISDPESYEIDIMLKEMANPTGLLTEVIVSKTEPGKRDFDSIIREIIGKGVKEEQIGLCNMGVISMCFGPMLHLRSISEDDRMPKPEFMPLDLGVERLADFIVRFSLAGMRSFSKALK